MGNISSKKFLQKPKNKNKRFSFYDDRKEDYDEREHLNVGIIKEIFKGHFSSPIQDILSNPNAKILDVGCGSGFWLTNMVADYPKPNYIGVDAAAVFPTSTIPNNIKFFQYNILEGLPFEDNTFDFIHMRFLVFEITESQWENLVYHEVARLLKPGGWLEVCDPDIEANNSGPITKKLQLSLCNHLKLNPYPTQRYRSFINSVPTFSSSTVYHEKKFLKLGSYADKIGEISAQHIIEIYKYIYMGPVGQEMNIKQEDIKSNLDLIEKEFEEYKTYYCIHKYYVRKP